MDGDLWLFYKKKNMDTITKPPIKLTVGHTWRGWKILGRTEERFVPHEEVIELRPKWCLGKRDDVLLVGLEIAPMDNPGCSLRLIM